MINTFATPGPITAEITLQSGGARITAEDRESTTVEILPANPGKKSDVEVAELTRVHFAEGRLDVRSPKTGSGLFNKPGTIEVIVRMPTGSVVRADTSYGDLDVDGELAECWLKTSYGDLRAQEATILRMESGYGNVTAGRLIGDTDFRVGWGKVEVEDVAAPLRIKTSGDVRLHRVSANVMAHTGYGHVTVDEATGGSLDLATSYGRIEVGVAQGAATYLELNTSYGKVRNELVPSDKARDDATTVEVRARTSYGDITIRRR
ncbi:MAG: DUF4097 family beta strand repeat-containing protein [Candidatus Dormibacteria bacterium]